jgi:arylsulfatase A-like enzyme
MNSLRKAAASETSEQQLRGTSMAAWVLAGMWCGIVTGLLEGAALTLLQSFGGMSWEMRLTTTSARILWVSPAAYVLIFGALGGALGLAARLLRRPQAERAAWFLLFFLSILTVLSASGRISRIGISVFAAGLSVALLRRVAPRREAACRFFRRTFPAAAALAALAGVAVEGGSRIAEARAVRNLPAARPGAPNVLIIVADTVRADHLSSYGYARQTSPHLDRVAREGAQFDGAIATSSWTLPTHASILTGRYPHEHGAELHGFDHRFRSLAEEFLARGYRTAAITANTLLFSRAQGFGPGFMIFQDSFYSLADSFHRTLIGRQLYKRLLRYARFEDIPGRRSGEAVTSDALAWLERHTDRPFFLFLNYFDAHDPYVPPQPWRSRFSREKEPGGKYNSFAGRYNLKVTPELVESESAAYDGAIAYVDHSIGLLLDALGRRGSLDNTILLITSDHGESFGEQNLMGHGGNVAIEQVHVPLILRWPEKIPAGLRIPTPVSHIHFASTLLELSGHPNPKDFPGPSLLPLLTPGANAAGWPMPLSELARQEFAPRSLPVQRGWMKSLTSERWHFTYHSADGPMLVDRTLPPAERANLIGTEAGRRVAEEFMSRLSAMFPDLMPRAEAARLLEPRKNSGSSQVWPKAAPSRGTSD